MIFRYTDGVTEATDAQEELFRDERLLNVMNNAPQFDDITMLGLRYLGKGE